mmetsp:Transcript_42205/g.78549  ORF Transcript_42205/g.78549 Transcript_42205/m.78549 type:complete len:582 (+) Transcript_42205:82-1827(+)
MPSPDEAFPLPSLRQHTLLESLDHAPQVAAPQKGVTGPGLLVVPASPTPTTMLASGEDGTCTLAANSLQHYQLQHAMFAELSSISAKLDKVMAEVHQRSVLQKPWQRGIPSKPVSTPKSSTSTPDFGSSLHASSVPFTPRREKQLGLQSGSTAEKFRRARTKVRFVAIMAAAGKRFKKRVRIDDMETESKQQTEASTARHGSSQRSLTKVAAHMMPQMWDSEAAERMEQIQKVLHADRNMQSMRMKLWQLLESPFSSKLAFTYAWVTNTLVVVSFALSSLEGQLFDYVQVGFEILFAVEFVIRVICCPHRCSFLCSPFNWIDLLSAAPLGFRFSNSDHKETVLALVPMLRLFKPLRRFEKLRLMVDAFSIALEALPVLLYSLALIAIVFAEIFFFVEPRDNISSLSYSLWFTIVTMFTVGYGDTTPTTTQGHVAASTLMVISALYMAMPLGIVGDAFSRAWADRDRLLVIKRFRGAFLEGGFSLQTFQHVFSVFDQDGSESLDVDEFALMLQTMQMKMTEERINVLFAALDKEGAGHITLEALINLLAPKAIGAHIFEQGASQAMNFLRSKSSFAEGDMAV